jgi:hypothetical protein
LISYEIRKLTLVMVSLNSSQNSKDNYDILRFFEAAQSSKS